MSQKKTAFEMVREFLQANGKPCPDVAAPMSSADDEFWRRLDDEEAAEYYDAMFLVANGAIDMTAVAKELADRIYILLGHAATLGLVRFDDVFAEVHRSNMSKLGRDGKPVLREDGKVMKGPDYREPDLSGLV